MTRKASLNLPSRLTVDGIRVALRYMTSSDRDAVLTFARSLAQADLVFLRRDITREDVVDEWVGGIVDGSVTTVLALTGKTVVGYATVHRSDLAWSAHVAELRVLLAEHVRRKGLGRRLTEEAFRIAIGLGLEKLTAQMPIDQTGATVTFRNLGFRPEALLRDQVKDRDGKKRDLLVMSFNIESFAAQLHAYGVDEIAD